MANWGIYAFPEPEVQAKRRFFNGPPHIQEALSYYCAESAFKDTAMTQPCIPGDDITSLADWSPFKNTMVAGASKPKFVIDNGFPCVQTNSIPLTGSVQYSAQYHFAVFRAPGPTFSGFGSCLGTVPNGRWPYLFVNGGDRLYDGAASFEDSLLLQKNGQTVANRFAGGTLAPINQMMLIFVQSESAISSQWQFGAQGIHKAPLYIYEAANFVGLTDEQVSDITVYLLDKYHIL